jgi:hypothetical protein
MGMVVVDVFFLVMVGYCSKMVIKTSKVTSPFFLILVMVGYCSDFFSKTSKVLSEVTEPGSWFQ